MTIKNKNIFQVADKIRRIEFDARIKHKCVSQDVIWLIDLIRHLEESQDVMRQGIQESEDRTRLLENERYELRKSQREWESRLWILSETYSDALDQSNQDLDHLNTVVQEVIQHQVPVNPEIEATMKDTLENYTFPQASTSIVSSYGMSQLTEASEFLRLRKETMINFETLQDLSTETLKEDHLKNKIPNAQLPYIGKCLDMDSSGFPLDDPEDTNPQIPSQIEKAQILKLKKLKFSN